MLLKVLVVLVTIAICFQRLSMALGSLGWGLGIAISIYFLFKKNKENKIHLLLQKDDPLNVHLKCMLILALVMLWGIIFTDNIGKSAKEYAEMWIYRPFPFVISSLVLRGSKYLRFILLCFGITFGLDCVVCLYQKLTLGIPGWGFGGHHNNLGSITAILIPMLIIGLLDATFSKKEKLFFGVALIFAIVGSIAGESRGAWVTIISVVPLVIVPYVWKNTKKLLLCLTLFLAVMGMIFTVPSLKNRAISTINTNTNYSNIGRFHMWNISMYMIKDHPLGIGAGRYAATYTKYYDPVYATPKDAQHLNHPHNNYLKVWTEFGSVGILVYLYICGYILRYNIKRWWQTNSPYAMMAWSGWLAFLIYGLFDVIVDHSAVTKIWWFILGSLLSFDDVCKERECLQNEK